MLQKIYSLPNCHLVVEGLSTTEDKTLTLLTHFQCQVGGKTISGGKELLCNLIKGVSYACQLAIAGEGVDYQDTHVTIGSKGFQYYLTVAERKQSRSPTRSGATLDLMKPLTSYA
jgi:hypothetical protein